jgi:hypothetical protein
MQPIKIRIYTLTIFFAFIFSSCDPYGGYQYWIDNQSNSDLYVILSNTSEDLRYKVESSEKKKIMQLETINGLYDKKEAFLDWCDSLGIYTDTIAKIAIKKDYLKRESWQYDQNVTGMMGKAGENIYTLTISNDDLK